MSLTNLTADLDIIQALDKRPNVFGNPPLSYDQLQAKFDEAANTIKTYLNGTLIPEIEAQKGDAADVAALQTEVIALKAVNRLVYCAQDVPKTALPADIITVGKNWFYPKPAVGDTVLGKNMYVARVTTIAGNDATLTGIGTVLTPKDFNVLNLLTVKAVGGVGGNIVAEGDLSVSGYTGLAGDLDVTGDTDITGDLDVVGNVTVTVDAFVGGTLRADGAATFNDDVTMLEDLDVTGKISVAGKLSASGDASIGGDLDVNGGASFGDEVLITSGGIGVQGAATFADGVGVTGAATFSDDVSVGGDLDVTGDITGDNLTLVDDLTAVQGTFSGDVSIGGLTTLGDTLILANNGNEVNLAVTGEDELTVVGENAGDVDVAGVKNLTASGDVSVGADMTVSGNASITGDLLSPNIKGSLRWANNGTPPKLIYGEVLENTLILFGTAHNNNVELKGVATPTADACAANKAYVDTAVSGRVAIAQGAGHAGEFLVVGSDGNVTTVTMTAWAGGSY